MSTQSSLFDGMCSRATCGLDGARWWNKSTRAYYCMPCARKIKGFV